VSLQYPIQEADTHTHTRTHTCTHPPTNSTERSVSHTKEGGGVVEFCPKISEHGDVSGGEGGEGGVTPKYTNANEMLNFSDSVKSWPGEERSPVYPPKSPTYPLKSPMNPQKSPMYPPKSPTLPHKSPMHLDMKCRTIRRQVMRHFVPSIHGQVRKAALHVYKRALYICERALHIR